MAASTHPSVSVIIPVYNGAGFVPSAIGSVLSQTFQDFEIIVVDDGSTDATKEVLAPWARTGKIQYLYQKNKGLAGARNSGLRHSKGRYLKFLDCDDLLYPRQLELQVEHLKDKTAWTISVTDYELEFESKNKKAVKVWLGASSQMARFIEANPCPVHTILVERALVERMGGFAEELLSQEDTDLWLRILIEGGRFEKIDYVGCCYRILDKSLSADKERMFKAHCRLSERINQRLLPLLHQMKNDLLEQLLMVNFKFIHTCFLRRIKPESCLPVTLQASGAIYAMKPSRVRQFMAKYLSAEAIAYLQFLKNSVADPQYRGKLDRAETFWREEKNYA